MQETEAQKRERRHREDLERLRGFRPIDDTFMRGLFKDNIPLAELVLRIIVGKPDLTLVKCETQADLKRVTGARSVCLDAYATDNTGKKYDIEIQRADNGADPHRARYHSSALDVENLDEKQEYRELPDSYVIFITENDYYKAGEPVYVIPTLLSQVITTIKDSSYLANVATIELMARTKQLLSAASRYNGTGNVNVSDVFVLFGVAALIYFIINYTLSCVVRTMQKRRKRPVRVTAD